MGAPVPVPKGWGPQLDTNPPPREGCRAALGRIWSHRCDPVTSPPPPPRTGTENAQEPREAAAGPPREHHPSGAGAGAARRPAQPPPLRIPPPAGGRFRRRRMDGHPLLLWVHNGHAPASTCGSTERLPRRRHPDPKASPQSGASVRGRRLAAPGPLRGAPRPVTAGAGCSRPAAELTSPRSRTSRTYPAPLP